MKSCLLVILALVLAALTLPPTPILATDFPLSTDDTVITDALNYLRGAQASDGNIGGFAVSAWVVMAIAAAGEDPHDWGNPSIVDYLRDNRANLDWSRATDVERSIMAITAAGEDPTDFGGQDYLAQLKNLYDGTQIGYDDTLNDDFWGILALASAGENLSSDIIVNTCAFIKYWQNEDGGWNWVAGDDSDVDDTTAAIIALITAGESPDSDAVIRGLAFLMDSQNDDGGFPSMFGGTSVSASSAWAIGAIVAAGEDPEDWVMGGGDDPVSNLISLQDSDGAFKHTASQRTSPEFMTAYAIPALLGDPYPVTAFQGQTQQPDLLVADIDVPTTIYTDTTITVTATIDNTGESDTDDSFKVELNVDGDKVDSVNVTALDAGEGVDVDFEWTPDAAGEYDLRVIADSEDEIDESNEGNNGLNCEVEAEERPEDPDLVVIDIDVLSTIYTDTTTTVTATIENSGERDTDDSFRVELNVDGDKVDSLTVTALDAGEDVDVELEWTPNATGDYTLRVIADAEDGIDESRETNNELTREVTVVNASNGSSQEDPSPTTPPPEEPATAILPVISVRIEPRQIDFANLAPGETSTEYTITITNNGSRDVLVTAEVSSDALDFYNATLKLNDWPWDTFRLVMPKQSSEVIRAKMYIPQSYSGQIAEGGILTFWATVDSND